MPNVIPKSVFESGVPLGKSRLPNSRLLRRLGAPLWWFRRSIAHIVVCEICSLPFRIYAVLRAPSRTGGMVIPMGHAEDGLPVSSGLACMQGMRKRARGSDQQIWSWMDCRLYSQAFHDGAIWAFDKTRTEGLMECLPVSPRISSAESITQQ